MQKFHVYKSTGLEQVESSKQETHEDMKETDSIKTDISDPGDVIDMIGSVTSAADLSSGSTQPKTGCSPMLTSYWRGTFNIKENVSEIDCCRNGQTQIAQCIYSGHFDHYVTNRQKMT